MEQADPSAQTCIVISGGGWRGGGAFTGGGLFTGFGDGGGLFTGFGDGGGLPVTDGDGGGLITGFGDGGGLPVTDGDGGGRFTGFGDGGGLPGTDGDGGGLFNTVPPQASPLESGIAIVDCTRRSKSNPAVSKVLLLLVTLTAITFVPTFSIFMLEFFNVIIAFQYTNG